MSFPGPLEINSNNSLSIKDHPKSFLSVSNLFYIVQGSFIADGLLSLLRPAKFSSSLRKINHKEIFAGTDYNDLKYKEALIAYRKDIKEKFKLNSLTESDKEMAYKMMTQPSLPQAHEILAPYLFGQAHEHKEKSLAELLSLDRKSINEQSEKAGQGIVNKNGLKLCGEIGVCFDPHWNGNLPFLLGTRTISGETVSVLRHPVPTIEMGAVHIAPEYEAFLVNCQDKEEKVLYCCLLDPKKSQENKRVQALYNLGPKYPAVFHFVRMPMDGPLSKVDQYESLETYRDSIKQDICNGVNYPLGLTNEFVFGSKKVSDIVFKNYEWILDLAYTQIRRVYNQDVSPEKSKELKQAYMMLVCTMLRAVLIRDLQVNYCNNTCKDAIDRGAAHLMSDLIWDSFLADKLDENRLNLRVSAAWPAFMAKTQAVLEDRSEWMDSFSKWIEKASLMGFREEMIKEYKSVLDLSVDENIAFNNPESKIQPKAVEQDIKMIEVCSEKAEGSGCFVS